MMQNGLSYLCDLNRAFSIPIRSTWEHLPLYEAQ